jgi:chromosomal replication initiation ATPase DnaA
MSLYVPISGAEKLQRILSIARIVADYYRVPIERIKNQYATGRAMEAKRMIVFMCRCNEVKVGYEMIGSFFGNSGHSFVELFRNSRTYFNRDEQMRDDLHELQSRIDKFYKKMKRLTHASITNEF